MDGAEQSNAAWYYPHPSPGYEQIADHIAIYAWALDEVPVDNPGLQLSVERPFGPGEQLEAIDCRGLEDAREDPGIGTQKPQQQVAG